MLARRLSLALLCASVGCGSSSDGESSTNSESSTSTSTDDSTSASTEDSGSETAEASGTSAGDGDSTSEGDTTGDGDSAGDGDSTGDGDSAGDGDTAGDGDSAGDGDAGDGDTSGGDGDTSGGDGDGDGDGDANEIHVVITADNAYGFGFGSPTAITTYYGDVVNTLAGDIFNCGPGPETYVLSASEADNADYLYIVSWRDNAVTQGVIGRFQRVGNSGTSFGDTIHTGDEGWEVCATGHEYVSPNPGPTQQAITDAIAECNTGTTDPNTTSGGWVDAVGTSNGRLAVGELNNDASGDFPIVCGNDTHEHYMPPEARWMWFDWDPGNLPQGPFRFPSGATGNVDHQFHIFRLAATQIPLPQ